MSEQAGQTLTNEEFGYIILAIIKKLGGRFELEPTDQAPAGSLFIYKNEDGNFVLQLDEEVDDFNYSE